MPYARKRRTAKTSRRTYRKGQSRRTATRRRYRPRRMGALKTSRAKWVNPIPQTSLYKLVYADTGYDMSCVGVTYRADHVFRGNGCFDPDVTSIGVQPYGWDQVVSLYPAGKYIVYGSKITATFYSQNPYNGPVKCFVFPSRSANMPTYEGNNDLMRMPYVRMHMIEGSGGRQRNQIISTYCKTRQLMRETSGSEVEESALVTADPTSIWYWHVVTDTQDTQQAEDINMDIKIVYYVRMIRIQDINES